MNNAEELKKYKELMDEGIITEEEYNQKKAEILALSNEAVRNKTRKKTISPKKKRVIFAVLMVAVVTVGVVFGIKSAVNASQTAKRNAAVIEYLSPIMEKYGIVDYTVSDIHKGYNFLVFMLNSLNHSRTVKRWKCLKN